MRAASASSNLLWISLASNSITFIGVVYKQIIDSDAHSDAIYVHMWGI